MPTALTADGVDVSTLLGCAIKATASDDVSFGSTTSELGIMLADGCWAVLGDGGQGSTTSEPGVGLVSGCGSQTVTDAGRS